VGQNNRALFHRNSPLKSPSGITLAHSSQIFNRVLIVAWVYGCTPVIPLHRHICNLVRTIADMIGMLLRCARTAMAYTVAKSAFEHGRFVLIEGDGHLFL